MHHKRLSKNPLLLQETITWNWIKKHRLILPKTPFRVQDRCQKSMCWSGSDAILNLSESPQRDESTKLDCDIDAEFWNEWKRKPPLPGDPRGWVLCNRMHQILPCIPRHLSLSNNLHRREGYTLAVRNFFSASCSLLSCICNFSRVSLVCRPMSHSKLRSSAGNGCRLRAGPFNLERNLGSARSNWMLKLRKFRRRAL